VLVLEKADRVETRTRPQAFSDDFLAAFSGVTES
jgi:hypothetical protein